MSSYKGIITPGEAMVDVISADYGGFAEKIIREIAHPINMPTNERHFGGWEEGVSIGAVHLPNGEKREVALKLGVKEGLFLKDDKVFSLKHECNGKLCIISVAERKDGVRLKSRRTAASIANAIAGTWILHGKNWINRNGTLFAFPYGPDDGRPEKFYFEVVDGSGTTLEEAISRGAGRSGHIGTWTKSTTLVPIALGIPTILHEFEQNAGGGNDITLFGDDRISADSEIWGPYASFSDKGMMNGVSTPFAMHLVKTREVFPNCELSSAFLLERLGEGKLLTILKTLAEKDPERFYRLIDSKGVTHKLERFDEEGGDLHYENGSVISTKQAPEIVLETFKELSILQSDPTYQLSKKLRLVMDSHFYIVVFGLLNMNEKGEIHQISGSVMYKYLTEGGQAHMHKLRNERVFGLVKKFFSVNEVKFFIYPSSSVRLPKINQYNFSPETWNPNHWLKKELTA